MTKFRIVSRPTLTEPQNSNHRWYRAQYKFLNLFWLNCDPDRRRPGLHESLDLEQVEQFIEAELNGECIDLSQKIVRIYE